MTLRTKKLEDVDRARESLEFASVDLSEDETALGTEFVNNIGDKDGTGFSGVTDAAGKVHRGPEEIVVVVYRLPRCQSDPDAQSVFRPSSPRPRIRP